MEVCFIDSPFEIETLPLDKIYVLDNWLAPIIHRKIDGVVKTANWRKTNEVRGDDPTGLPMHQFWGSTMNRDDDWAFAAVTDTLIKEIEVTSEEMLKTFEEYTPYYPTPFLKDSQG